MSNKHCGCPVNKYSFTLERYFTGPNEPRVEYPDGFQGNEIPVFGPMVAQLIEDRVDGKL